MELSKKNYYAHLKNTSGDMRMPSDLQLVYVVLRNSTQLLNINTTKIQVERESVYSIAVRPTLLSLYQDYDRNHLDNHDYIIIIIDL